MELESVMVGSRRSVSEALAAIAIALCLVGSPLGLVGCASDSGGASASESADAGQDGSGRLEPRYQPREPVPEPFYNNSYLFGMTRGVTGSTIHPAAQVPLLVLTIPLDIVFLPFGAIAGFF
jgi:hypothetical protein